MITPRYYPALLIWACIFLASACTEPYVKQPFAGDTAVEHAGINSTQMAAIQQQLGTKATDMAFAIMGDTHVHYDEMRSVLEHIAADTSIRFILVCGDVTDKGTVDELKRYLEEIQAVDLPFVTVIGNREHNALGRISFEEMFGARNSQFITGGVRFILFDNVVTESDLPLDFDWLRTTLAAPHDGTTIIAMHIPPSDGTQLSKEILAELYAIVEEHGTDHVFMGHTHAYAVGEFPDGTPYTTVSWPKDGEYVKAQIIRRKLTTELVKVFGNAAVPDTITVPAAP